mgnify:CR=1 FL=1
MSGLSNYITPVSELRVKYYSEGDVYDYARDIITDLNYKITDACNLGKKKLIVEIPTVFNSSNMSIVEVRNHVYFLIMITLEKSGYEIKFLHKGQKNNKRVYLRVKWVSEQDTSYYNHISSELSNRSKEYR